jgi:hypothetical protein
MELATNRSFLPLRMGERKNVTDFGTITPKPDNWVYPISNDSGSEVQRGSGDRVRKQEGWLSMPSKRSTDLGRLGDLASLLALAGAPVILPSAIRLPAQVAAYGLLVAAVGRLVYSLTRRVRALLRANKLGVAAPTLLLVGGARSKEEMNAIANQPRLHSEPYIKVEPVSLPDADLHARAAKAHGLILMSDFTKEAFQNEYRDLKWLSQRLPMPVSRYYAHNYSGQRVRDFLLIPFDTQEALVDYVSEDLLQKTVERARLDAMKSRLYLWGFVTCFVLLLGMAGWALRLNGQIRDHAHRYRAGEAENSKTREVLTKVVAAAAPDATANSKVEAYRAIVEEALHQINQRTGGYNATHADLFLVANLRNKLIPVLSWGGDGYEIPDDGSIAGCAIRENAEVYWTGDRKHTKAINAFSLVDGSPVGVYDAAAEKLQIGPEDCRYYKGPPADRAVQLLCAPIVIGTSNPVGALCVSSEDETVALDEKLVRNLLLWNTTLLALTKPTPLDHHLEERISN